MADFRRSLSIFFALLSFAFSSKGLCQWVQTNGPYSGNISCFANLGSEIFAGTWGNGVYHSTDSGLTWNQASIISKGFDINAILPIDTFLLALGDPRGVEFGELLLKSTDRGKTWTNIGTSVPWLFYSLTLDGHTLRAGVGTDAFGPIPYISLDSGRTWSFDTLAPSRPKYTNTTASLGDYQFAGTVNGSFRSTDSGTHWSKMNDLGDLYISQLDTSSGILYAAGIRNQVFRSADSGTSWVLLDTFALPGYLRQILAVRDILFAVMDSGIYRSKDNGVTWSFVAAPSDLSAIYPVGPYLLGMTYTLGILRSSDTGINWKAVGINTSEINHITVIDSTLFVSTILPNYHASIFRSTNKGISWEPAIDEGLEPYLFTSVSLLIGSGTVLFTSAVNRYALAISTDEGRSWAPFSNTNYGGNSAFSLAARGETIFIGSDYDRVYASIDKGRTWKEIDQGMYSTANDATVDALAVIDSTVFAGTRDKGLFRSTDFGKNWEASNNGIAGKYVSSLAVMGTNLFAGIYPEGVLLSTDKGDTWTHANTGMGSIKAVNRLLVVGSSIFAASWDSGIYVSANKGSSWTRVDSGITNSSVYDLVVLGNELYAATDGSGVWHRPLSEMIISSAVLEPLQHAETGIQSYPNPFIQSTTIHFTSPERGFAQVTVVNLLGEHVARLFEGELEAGEHSFEWDAKGQTPGTYFCIIRESDRTSHAALVLAH